MKKVYHFGINKGKSIYIHCSSPGIFVEIIRRVRELFPQDYTGPERDFSLYLIDCMPCVCEQLTAQLCPTHAVTYNSYVVIAGFY